MMYEVNVIEIENCHTIYEGKAVYECPHPPKKKTEEETHGRVIIRQIEKENPSQEITAPVEDTIILMWS